MFVHRLITPYIEKALSQFPVVLLTGPRQTGKTELLKHAFPNFEYFSLDALDIRLKAQSDPRSFFNTQKPGIIIDEIQEATELLSYVKENVDRKKGKPILLTGSHQFHLMKGVSESLAGRVAVMELLPFSVKELSAAGHSIGSFLLKGMYPKIQITPELNIDLWFSSYINTYLERDLRSQVAVKDIRAFEALLQILASRIGQELNMSSLATDIGVNVMTIKAWISALEASYVLYLLPPYYKNFGKRLIKSPKIYFLDTGLVCHLTKIKNEEMALSGPLAGFLFENFMVSEFIKSYSFKAQKPPLYFWRSHDGLEVDLLIDHGAFLEGVECKLSHTITDQHVPNLQRFKKIVESEQTQLTVVSLSEHPALSRDLKHLRWDEIDSEK